ncbi:Crp/Fnr family transcriptional regulator [Sporolactobacillus pectinivorans]|uniref:Crp/Fnr family transcriptional regulator n=1 Tax=Sporolactobacillus pectinivorans TaxID=1591408 RepID=UPI000C25CD95|nr:Crp/Fnr family transcriptional regulator [Sporolactobacillus pectinivorans]
MIAKTADSALHRLFRKSGSLKEFKKNSFVFVKGDMARETFFIEDGLLKICQTTCTGQDVTFFIRNAHEFFGVAEVVLQQDHPCYAQCLRTSKIWTLPAQILHEKIYSDPEVNQEVLQTLTRRLIQQEYTVEQLACKSASSRLAWLINQLCHDEMKSGWSLHLSLTHEEMSNIIGCSRQTISETFNEWRSRGIIHYSRNNLTIVRPDHLIAYL